MNSDHFTSRQQHRAAERQARKRPSASSSRTNAHAYRVPRGRIALTLDLAGAPPSTSEINQDVLTDLLGRLDELVGERSYQHVLNLVGIALPAAQAGDASAESLCSMLGYWVAFNHPQGGPQMRRSVSDAMAADKPVHLTLHGAAAGGIVLALSDRFLDLGDIPFAAKAAGAGFLITKVSDQQRRQAGDA